MKRIWLVSLPLLLAVGCGRPEPGSVQVPARVLYFEASSLEDQEVLSIATERLQTLIDENPGTRLAIFAHLRLGDIYSKNSDWDEAEASYRLFLALNSNSHLTSYALYRLMRVNFEKSLTGLFFPTREVDRDMEPNRQLMLEFKRFFLLYPNSIYMDDVFPLHRAAREMLARYELMVGDFYMKRESFHSAIGRYLYMLRNFPEYPESHIVLKKLISAYRSNRQEDLAREMERIYDLRFSDDVTWGDKPYLRGTGYSSLPIEIQADIAGVAG